MVTKWASQNITVSSTDTERSDVTARKVSTSEAVKHSESEKQTVNSEIDNKTDAGVDSSHHSTPITTPPITTPPVTTPPVASDADTCSKGRPAESPCNQFVEENINQQLKK